MLSLRGALSFAKGDETTHSSCACFSTSHHGSKDTVEIATASSAGLAMTP